MDAVIAKSAVVPFSLKDAPSLIEKVWPAQKISVEAQKERKAGPGQTLPSLGSYWKGRKPLVLARACALAALLPATGNDEADLRVFEILAGISDDQVEDRFKTNLTAQEIRQFGSPSEISDLLDEDGSAKKLPKETKIELMSRIITRMPYQLRVDKLLRPEEVPEEKLTSTRLTEVNRHLGTDANSLGELIEQLGNMRFGRRAKLGDTFAGGGSIPFEAARIGFDVFASDLNPIACMLTWGALNIVGADPAGRNELERDQRAADKQVDQEITKLGIEHDAKGNRAKAYLYCLEATCPATGWSVPLLGTRLISRAWRTVVELVPDTKKKRFDLKVKSDASDADLDAAAEGTVQDGSLVFTLKGETYSTPIKTIRGDRRGGDGRTINDLRPWEKSDFIPRDNDIFRERLYCVQWIARASAGKAREETYFATPTDEDIAREHKVQEVVRKNLAVWQEEGLLPNMKIEAGEETSRLLRERGWTYWHHLFGARALLRLALERKHGKGPVAALQVARNADRLSRLCRYNANPQPSQGPKIEQTFSNQALNPLINYGLYSYAGIDKYLDKLNSSRIAGTASIECADAALVAEDCDVWITDPPYADAVNYHEITEFFIAWLRRNPPRPFDRWIWDSRRALAIQGDGHQFRQRMVAAYSAMTRHMPDNGTQIVMFTHQSASVWADMAQIFWGSGLQVMAAWYIATETTSELKKGGYVQGTVILVARKRRDDEAGYKDEIVQEVRAEVAEQIDTMVGLNQNLRGRGRAENIFEDADLQMAGYAAALRVLTRYARIDGVDMTKEALRGRRDGEKDIVGEIIDFAVQVANEHMVPEHMSPKLWEALSGAERFYFKMMDIETTSLRKLDNYQNFAKAFRASDYIELMGSVQPNKARLKTAKEFKKSGFEIPEFGPSATRAVLYAIYELENEVDGDEVLSHLRDMLPAYHSKRDDLAAIAEYIARKREKVDETESRAARILHGLIRNERLG